MKHMILLIKTYASGRSKHLKMCQPRKIASIVGCTFVNICKLLSNFNLSYGLTLQTGNIKCLNLWQNLVPQGLNLEACLPRDLSKAHQGHRRSKGVAIPEQPCDPSHSFSLTLNRTFSIRSNPKFLKSSSL
ncbi:hypothetical protein IEQ34_013670 [Dendrobium chrysotoxum]|uniref:Uncharacterized protein n=1 Tax=Dendrobium chrysotoxum TaxID=161865 RepID=A0AAV7G9H9_DENCH|nr:hypothetical protein IEQ34_013670 [Dendrobium chrysotoxum]